VALPTKISFGWIGLKESNTLGYCAKLLIIQQKCSIKLLKSNVPNSVSRHVALPTKIGLGWIGLKELSTLAYCAKLLIIQQKSLITIQNVYSAPLVSRRMNNSGYKFL
jgi:hypothetical protein